MIGAFEVQVTEEHPEGYVRASPEDLLPLRWVEHFRRFTNVPVPPGGLEALRGDGTEAETGKEKKEPVR